MHAQRDVRVGEERVDEEAVAGRQALDLAQIGHDDVVDLEAVALQQRAKLLLLVADAVDAPPHLGLLQDFFDRQRAQPRHELAEVLLEVAEARARIDRVSEEDVAPRALDVVGRELRGVETVGLVDELGEPFERRVLFEVVLVHEARRRRSDAMAAFELRGRLLVAVGQEVMVEPLPGVRVVRKVREDVVAANLHAFVGDVLRMHEQDLVDRLLHRDDDGARQTVQIGARDQSHGRRVFIRVGKLSPPFR